MSNNKISKKSIKWRYLIKKSKLGKPTISFSNKVKKILIRKFKSNRFKVFLSLSDEKHYSIAYVIINKS